MMMMMDTYECRKASWTSKTAGSPWQRLAQQDSGGCQRSTAIYVVSRSPGVTERRNGHSDYVTRVKNGGKTNFQGTYTGCPEPGLLNV